MILLRSSSGVILVGLLEELGMSVDEAHGVVDSFKADEIHDRQ